jgi:hypothetical protein
MAEDPATTCEALSKTRFTAETAVAAGRDAREEYSVSWEAVVDTWSGFEDGTYCFVAKDSTGLYFGNVSF